MPYYFNARTIYLPIFCPTFLGASGCARSSRYAILRTSSLGRPMLHDAGLGVLGSGAAARRHILRGDLGLLVAGAIAQ